MDLEIKNKVIIITGGSRGIGAGIARAVAMEEGIPVMAGRSRSEGEQLVREFQEQGRKAHFIAVELGMPESCLMVVDETLKNFGRIDGLVNNAGANDGVGLENGSPERFRVSIQHNLDHYYAMAHYALPALKESKGSILNISSKTALTGQGNTSAYAAAKGAQLALTREWAVELLKYSIRVNAIIPSEVMTPHYQSWIKTFENPEDKLLEITDHIPLGKRMTSAAEIADMAVFLLSARASHITGQFLFVDGGYVHLDRALL